LNHLFLTGANLKVLQSLFGYRMLRCHSGQSRLFASRIHGVAEKQYDRGEGQQVHPQSTPGEKRLSQFESDHRENLAVHFEVSPPIKYSYTESTLLSAGAMLSISISPRAM